MKTSVHLLLWFSPIGFMLSLLHVCSLFFVHCFCCLFSELVFFFSFQYCSHCIFYILFSFFSLFSTPPPTSTLHWHTHSAVQRFRPLQPHQLPLPAQQRGELGLSHRLPLLPHPIITLHLHLQPHPLMATPRLSFATRLPSLLHAGAHDSIIKSAQLEGLFAHLSRLLTHPTSKHSVHFLTGPMLCNIQF